MTKYFCLFGLFLFPLVFGACSKKFIAPTGVNAAFTATWTPTNLPCGYPGNTCTTTPIITLTITPTPITTFTCTNTVTSVINVTTLAGSGAYGSTNGTGTAASFETLVGIAVDASGNVYVADASNNLIRKITSGGVVTTLAGSGSSGSANGAGTAASFNFPDGVAIDTSGNVYVADASNNLIRKITSGGVVTTLAGQAGVTGSTNGTGTAASFNHPFGVAVDTSGNVYVADVNNNLIRKITLGGVVTTLAGRVGVTGSTNGTGTVASFYDPYGVAVDTSGNVYVADEVNRLIRKITQ
jgi:hypothetical protein